MKNILNSRKNLKMEKKLSLAIERAKFYFSKCPFQNAYDFVKQGLYKHHKGDYYLILSSTVIDEKSGDMGVIYVSLNEPYYGNINFRKLIELESKDGWFNQTEDLKNRFELVYDIKTLKEM